ncbi:unnamed protein product [Cochlearia groenlandica]
MSAYKCLNCKRDQGIARISPVHQGKAEHKRNQGIARTRPVHQGKVECKRNQGIARTTRQCRSQTRARLRQSRSHKIAEVTSVKETKALSGQVLSIKTMT